MSCIGKVPEPMDSTHRGPGSVHDHGAHAEARGQGRLPVAFPMFHPASVAELGPRLGPRDASSYRLAWKSAVINPLRAFRNWSLGASRAWPRSFTPLRKHSIFRMAFRWVRVHPPLDFELLREPRPAPGYPELEAGRMTQSSTAGSRLILQKPGFSPQPRPCSCCRGSIQCSAVPRARPQPGHTVGAL